MFPDNRRQLTRRTLRRFFSSALALTIGGIASWWPLLNVSAMHAADHRFNVEGYVCSPDGKPMADILVTAKDTRVDVRASSVTDSQGYYKVVLHLHNDNNGDPIVVMANDEEKKTTASFDPKDSETDRGAKILFGGGCENRSQGTPPWVYYTVGVGLAMAGAVAGARLIKAKRKSTQRRRGKRK